MSKKLKTLLITTVSIILVVAILVGTLWYFANKLDPVAVTSVSELVMGYTDEEPVYDGTVSTNNLQAIYLSGTQTVLEVYVTEGQSVQKGDALFRYDTTLTDIQLERQRLASEQAQLNLKEAKAELEEIKKMKPYSPPPTTRPTTQATTGPLEPEDDLPMYISGRGTRSEPYRYLWDEDLEFDEEFLREHLSAQRTECWLAFEIRESNALKGKLLNLWGLYVTVVEPEAIETYPTESGTDSTEETEATEPTESSATEVSTEETSASDDWKHWELSYRFFIPEEREGDAENTTPTVTETEWVDTSSGYTSAEIAVMRQEKELQIRDLDLEARMAKLTYETMKLEMSTGIVKATVTGTVVGLKDAVMSQVSGEPFIQVSEGGSFYVSIRLGEYDLDRYELGSLVTISSWMNYGYTTTGSLVAISNEPVQDDYYYYGGNSDVSVYEATIIVPSEAKLQEGEWVGVSFASDRSGESGSLYLESAYIREENGRSYVYRRNVEGLLEKTYIQTGTVMWGYTAVLSGLTEEDWIAFPYGKDVVDGAPTYEEESELYFDDMLY